MPAVRRGVSRSPGAAAAGVRVHAAAFGRGCGANAAGQPADAPTRGRRRPGRVPRRERARAREVLLGVAQHAEQGSRATRPGSLRAPRAVRVWRRRRPRRRRTCRTARGRGRRLPRTTSPVGPVEGRGPPEGLDVAHCPDQALRSTYDGGHRSCPRRKPGCEIRLRRRPHRAVGGGTPTPVRCDPRGPTKGTSGPQCTPGHKEAGPPPGSRSGPCVSRPRRRCARRSPRRRTRPVTSRRR